MPTCPGRVVGSSVVSCSEEGRSSNIPYVREVCCTPSGPCSSIIERTTRITENRSPWRPDNYLCSTLNFLKFLALVLYGVRFADAMYGSGVGQGIRVYAMWQQYHRVVNLLVIYITSYRLLRSAIVSCLAANLLG